MKRPHILLCNDDGIKAPGLMSLWRALKEADICDLTVIAPTVERSGTGVAITWDRPMRIQEAKWYDGTPSWSVDGTPADCIKMGLRVILKTPPDFIFSGINAGSNAGRNVLHSGTVGAVIEGVFRGIPGAAISCEDVKQPNFHVAEKHMGTLLEYLLLHPLPPGCFLNINYPQVAEEEVKGFKLTRQGKGRWTENPSLHSKDEEGHSYWLGGVLEVIPEEEESDMNWLQQGYMTAVPINVHELTEMREWERRKESFESFFGNKNGLERNS